MRIPPLAAAGALAATVTACGPSPSTPHARAPDRIQVAWARDDDGAPRFVLKDSTGVITENEFVRRFRTVMDTSEIDHLEKRRNWTTVAVLGSLLAAAVVVNVWGLVNMARSCEADDELFTSGCDHRGEGPSVPSGYRPLRKDGFYYYDPDGITTSDAGIFAAVLGGVGAAAAGAGLGVALANGDGSPFDHELTRGETEQYLHRYNDRLPATEQRRGSSRGPTVRIGAGPGSVSIIGAF